MPKLLALANLTAHRRLQTGDFPTFGCSLTEAHRGGLAPELKTQHCIEREGYLRYPADFHGLRNRVEHCVDPARGERVIFSNGVPDHDIELQRHKARPSPFCEARYQVRMPLRPRYVGEVTEISSTEPIAWRLNGVPLYSSAWAVWNRFIFSSYAARGHQGSYTSLWHYHLLCEPGQDCEARGAVMPPPEARELL
mmetsp:Transcript_22920/g.73464  ORF Transcript_22920/g.73464 Transcript_22920/m.73464 type:complete len:195 (-) Transcript_22920:23-607(-)